MAFWKDRAGYATADYATMMAVAAVLILSLSAPLTHHVRAQLDPLMKSLAISKGGPLCLPGAGCAAGG